MADSVSGEIGTGGVEVFLEEMLAEVSRSSPDDPIQFMYDYIGARLPRRSRASRQSSIATAGIVQEHMRRLEQDLGPEISAEDLSDFHDVLSADVSSAASKNLALQRVAFQLRKEDESIHAFVREWIDQPERLAECRAPRRMSASSSRTENDAKLPICSGTSLESLISWDFDPFAVSDAELVRNTYQVFQLWGFLQPDTETPIDTRKLQCYISAIYSAYESSNPYHNFKHAYCVLAGTANIMKNGASQTLSLTRVEELALLIAGLTHDVGHPGYNNDYFVKTHHKLALRYNDNAVLENMHCSLAFQLLQSNNFTTGWPDSEYQAFRKATITAIMNTDMRVHFDLISRLQDSDITDGEQRKAIVSTLVHAADLSNPVLPTPLCHKWAVRVVSEFHRQAKREQREGLPFAPFMACRPDDSQGVAALQISFINYVVAPMWTELVRLFPGLADRKKQLDVNLAFWQSEDETSNETCHTPAIDSAE